MSNLISFDDWKNLTKGGMTGRRSSELKAIDRALEEFHKKSTEVNRRKVKTALDGWIKAKGPAWKQSKRNSRQAVDTLRRQINGPVAKGGAAEMFALSAVRDEARAIATDLFQGQNLVFRSGLLTKVAGNTATAQRDVSNMVRGTASHAKDVMSHFRSKSEGNKAAKGLLDSLIPADIRPEVMSHLASIVPNFMAEFASKCIPFVGVVSSGGSALVSAGTALKSKWDLRKTQRQVERSLSMETPEKAFQAVVRMLNRERTQQKSELAIGVADFGAKLTTLLVDGGAISNSISSLVAGLAKLSLVICVVVRDVQESRAANKVLKRPVIDEKLFQACPLMGAYFVLNVPTSVLVNSIFLSEKFYDPGMMIRVEQVVKHNITPLRITAKRLVDEHRMFIPDLILKSKVSYTPAPTLAGVV